MTTRSARLVRASDRQVVVQLDAPECPRLVLTSPSRGHRCDAPAVSAEDDLGGIYAESFGPGFGQDGYHEHSLEFRPRLHRGPAGCG